MIDYECLKQPDVVIYFELSKVQVPMSSYKIYRILALHIIVFRILGGNQIVHYQKAL